ncbi:MAG: tetratricopeptide repeat protein [Cytophagales bacterium]|nr:tetratricopeptide repeat protein [Cytophagales bacterium]MDW8383534.1 tetratricopeptide repeat protein [Flammeovirgaceae bacterium]
MIIRESAFLTFRFRFVNRRGVRSPLLPLSGWVSAEALVLDKNYIWFQDIIKAITHEDVVIIFLKPYATLGKGISPYILSDYCALLLDVEYYSSALQSIINRHIISIELSEKKRNLTKEEIQTWFKTVRCCACEAILDISGLPASRLLYCSYCHSLIDRHGNILIGFENYKICPETGFYDRLKTRYVLNSYFYGTSQWRFSFRKYYAGDYFVLSKFAELLRKNSFYVIGSITALLERIKASHGRTLGVEKLPEAILAAKRGKWNEAEILFESMLIRTSDHPGVCYNYALLLTEKKEFNKAIFYLKRALDVCCNYQPALELLEKCKFIS